MPSKKGSTALLRFNRYEVVGREARGGSVDDSVSTLLVANIDDSALDMDDRDMSIVAPLGVCGWPVTDTFHNKGSFLIHPAWIRQSEASLTRAIGGLVALVVWFYCRRPLLLERHSILYAGVCCVGGDGLRFAGPSEEQSESTQ